MNRYGVKAKRKSKSDGLDYGRACRKNKSQLPEGKRVLGGEVLPVPSTTNSLVVTRLSLHLDPGL